MPTRVNGGVFDQQVLTGSLAHFVVCGADFSGAFDPVTLQPVPGSAAEIIFQNISESAYIEIMNPNQINLSFALDAIRSTWDETSLTTMIQSLGTNVGVDHVDCAVCTVTQVPYIWSCGAPGGESFLDLTDTPDTYAGAAGYVVVVNNTETGLVFEPVGITSNAFAFVQVPTQPELIATGEDTLTIIPGTDVIITANALAKSITINSTAGTDYIPVPSGTTLQISKRYYVTGPYFPGPATATLPSSVGAGFLAGQSIHVTKPSTFPTLSILIISVGAITDIISTDLGTTNSLEFDATQEVIFVFDGVNTWNLQIGSTY
jgi:hypothetical protein